MLLLFLLALPFFQAAELAGLPSRCHLQIVLNHADSEFLLPSIFTFESSRLDPTLGLSDFLPCQLALSLVTVDNFPSCTQLGCVRFLLCYVSS